MPAHAPPAETVQGESRVVCIMAPSAASTELLLRAILLQEVAVHHFVERPVHPHLWHQRKRTVLVFCTSVGNQSGAEGQAQSSLLMGEGPNLRRLTACSPAPAPCPYAAPERALLPSCALLAQPRLHSLNFEIPSTSSPKVKTVSACSLKFGVCSENFKIFAELVSGVTNWCRRLAPRLRGCLGGTWLASFTERGTRNAGETHHSAFCQAFQERIPGTPIGNPSPGNFGWSGLRSRMK